MSSTATRARGRWREILPAFGIGPQFLINRHGPCPICGGKDRYRFDDRNGDGTYFCNQCGPGNGLILIQKLKSWDFATAAREVDRIIGNAPPKPASATREADTPAQRLAKCEQILAEATRHQIVTRYLESRSLNLVPTALRGHGALPYVDGSKFLGRYPAVLAPVHGPDGALQSVHRTYLAEHLPVRKKLMPAVDTVRGGVVRLFPIAEHLGIGEGIETAVAAAQIFGIGTWAAISANGLEAWQPPQSVRKVTIFGDNDQNFTGQRAAYALANRLRLAGLEVRVEIPEDAGTDWCDALAGEVRT